jgi:hypothetical protein
MKRKLEVARAPGKRAAEFAAVTNAVQNHSHADEHPFWAAFS